MTVGKLSLTMCAMAAMTAATLPAAAISGSFSMSGVITVSPTTISWTSDVLPNASQMFTLSGGAGSFANENGQNGVDNLNIAAEPVGSTFAATPFIIFDVVPGLPNLNINFIRAGIDGTAGCSSSPAAAGQICTPPNPGGSPFNFQNLTSTSSTASFAFSGVTSDGLSSWTATFTSQFNSMPFQTVLSNLAANGSVTNTYAASVTVVPLPSPEPGAGFMLGSGLALVLLSLGTKRFFGKRVTQ